VGLHVLDVLMHCAYALNVKYGSDSNVTFLKYRESVIKSLMGLEYRPRLQLANPDSFHYLMLLPPTEKKAKPTKPSQVCSRQKKRRRRHVIFVKYAQESQPFALAYALKYYHLKD